ncbi:MAG: DNA methyltransferase [Chloroflexota bacterium]
MIELLNCDCMEYMKDCKDNEFDLAIVDPPYGIGNFIPDGENKGDKYKRRKANAVTWNDNIPDKRYFDEMFRVSKNQIIWGANYYNCFPSIGGAIIWDKKNNHPNMSKCEIASCSFHKKVEYYHQTILKGFCTDEIQVHPCQKPVKLYDWLLTNYAEKGQRILDTHLGSGSSAIAAHYFGCDFVGMEIDEDYYKAACERFDRETRQVSMF